MEEFEAAIPDLIKGFQLMPDVYAHHYSNRFFLFFSLFSVGRIEDAIKSENHKNLYCMYMYVHEL